MICSIIMIFSGLFFAGHDPARGSDQEIFKPSRVEGGRIRGVWKYHGWVYRVGSAGFQVSWLGVGPRSPDPTGTLVYREIIRSAHSPAFFYCHDPHLK